MTSSRQTRHRTGPLPRLGGLHTKGLRRIARRLLAIALYLLYLLATVAVLVELGARILIGADDADQVQAQALPRLLNSAWVGGDTGGSLFPHLAPSTRTTVQHNELAFTVVTNSLGFRGRDPAPRQAGEYRLLFLGDSMVFGDGLEETETLPAQVEALAAERGHMVVAYNGAISGLNTVEELLVARHLVPVLAPDHVVLGYFVGNDPLANTLAHVDSAGACAFDTDRSRHLSEALAAHLQPWLHSHAFRAVALRYYVPLLRYKWSARDGVLSRSYDLLARLREDCRAGGAALSVVLIYPRDGVAGGLRSRLSGSRNVGRRLARGLAARGIEVLDTAEFMSGGGADESYYFPVDGHLNAAGGNVVAQLVTADLIERRLSPRRR